MLETPEMDNQQPSLKRKVKRLSRKRVALSSAK
nr:MAG TPA: hypothetical protein [Crassvirales sp.]